MKTLSERVGGISGMRICRAGYDAGREKGAGYSLIARSYGNACMLRSFQGFRSKKDIYFYEEEVQVSNDGCGFVQEES